MVPEGTLSTGAVSPSGCTEGPLPGGSRAKRDWTGHGPYYVLVPNCKSPQALWHRVGGGRGRRYLWSWADDGLRPPQSKRTAGVGAAAGRCERCVASGVQAHHPLAWRILILYGAPLSSGLIAMFCRPYYSESRRPESTFLSTFLVVCSKLEQALRYNPRKSVKLSTLQCTGPNK